MAKKLPKINLAPTLPPPSADLEKLFATEGDVETASGLQLLALRLDAIQPDPAQPRHTFDTTSLKELAESIRQDGVIQPIEVTEMGDGRYLIVHGERRWRAAKLAGLDTIPAVVQRRNYDSVTRFVRQLVENIQREDLNDVDRAAGLLRLRSLLQVELTAAKQENVPADEPWGQTVTWAKVGKRLGYSRQRIHQLIQLLNLPDEIQESVREGVMSERETRPYQGLTAPQQRALHAARLAGDVTDHEARKIADYLRTTPEYTVHQAMRLLRQPAEPTTEPPFDASSQPLPISAQPLAAESDLAYPPDERPEWINTADLPRTSGMTGIDRLEIVRGHLTRIPTHGLTPREHHETLRLLKLIYQDSAALIEALELNKP